MKLNSFHIFAAKLHKITQTTEPLLQNRILFFALLFVKKSFHLPVNTKFVILKEIKGNEKLLPDLF